MRARCVPSTSTFTVPSGSFSICRMVDDAADLVQVLAAGLVLGRRPSARPAGCCLPASIAASSALIDFGRPDEQRDHHVREDDHVAQRQQRQRDRLGGQDGVRTLGTFLSQADMRPERGNSSGSRDELPRGQAVPVESAGLRALRR